MPSEKSQTSKATYYMISLIENTQSRQIHRDKKEISGSQGLGERDRERLFNGSGVSFRVMSERTKDVIGVQAKTAAPALALWYLPPFLRPKMDCVERDRLQQLVAYCFTCTLLFIGA